MKAAVQSTQAIVAHAPEEGKRNWILEEVQVGPPDEYEAIVEMVASGVCHTDLGCGTAPDGTPGFPVPPYPRVLGHEGAGYVRQVGSKITKVKAGDAVLLSFAFCTQCHNCKTGAPGYCHEFSALNFAGSKTAFQLPSEVAQDVGGSFFGQSSFSKLARVQETSLVNVTKYIKSDDDLKLLAPLGCGIQAAKLQGCKTIIGIDRLPARIEMAKSLGATHGIDTSSISSLPDEIRTMTDGTGSTITIDATGVMPLIQNGLDFTANQGQMIILGVAPMTAGLEVSVVPFMVTGKKLMGSMEGGVYPEKYIPRLIRWVNKGQFPVDRLIKYYPAIKDMEEGTTIKPVLVW
ncbi:hypothetical protein FZEAL_6537 [Fusarium zealandicum]|uniref:Enoyl reductase (ER) domain-containing protein n=1 Tax=Fusarium zealandicum TaxID=1053134 RepID=A0A8H4UHK8_9HYPO|nr:hypothetical protein FZEAL_6537 [Fusarium zealandicum]